MFNANEEREIEKDNARGMGCIVDLLQTSTSVIQSKREREKKIYKVRR